MIGLPLKQRSGKHGATEQSARSAQRNETTALLTGSPSLSGPLGDGRRARYRAVSSALVTDVAPVPAGACASEMERAATRKGGLESEPVVERTHLSAANRTLAPRVRPQALIAFQSAAKSKASLNCPVINRSVPAISHSISMSFEDRLDHQKRRQCFERLAPDSNSSISADRTCRRRPIRLFVESISVRNAIVAAHTTGERRHYEAHLTLAAPIEASDAKIWANEKRPMSRIVRTGSVDRIQQKDCHRQSAP